MKRTPLGAGAKSLQRGSTFAAKPTGLKRPKPKTRRGKKRPTVPDFWKKRTVGLCACGCGRPAVHGHHIIYAQVLKRHGLPLYSRPNHMPVAAECHANHHNARRRLPLPADHPVRAFAESHGLTWWLQRTYDEGGSSNAS